MNTEEGAKSKPLSDALLGKMAGGFGRKLGTGVKVPVAVHYVPGHYCFAFVGFERGRFVYAGPYFGFVDEQRDCGLTALARSREHLQ